MEQGLVGQGVMLQGQHQLLLEPHIQLQLVLEVLDHQHHKLHQHKMEVIVV
jgi:hypothetical protein